MGKQCLYNYNVTFICRLNMKMTKTTSSSSFRFRETDATRAHKFDERRPESVKAARSRPCRVQKPKIQNPLHFCPRSRQSVLSKI